MSSLMAEPGHVDEPREAEAYANVLSDVASQRQPVIVRRDGIDLAAVIPLEYLELMREILASREAEQLAAQIDWPNRIKNYSPPQKWFDSEEPKPF